MRAAGRRRMFARCDGARLASDWMSRSSPRECRPPCWPTSSPKCGQPVLATPCDSRRPRAMTDNRFSGRPNSTRSNPVLGETPAGSAPRRRRSAGIGREVPILSAACSRPCLAGPEPGKATDRVVDAGQLVQAGLSQTDAQVDMSEPRSRLCILGAAHRGFDLNSTTWSRTADIGGQE